jgi:CheY-like chemotaxis protein
LVRFRGFSSEQGDNVIKRTVLIVEDYEDSRLFMKILVEGCGYYVIEAENGFEAVDKVRQLHPDLILMDISMPLMDGLTATRIIKASKDTSEIPVIAVTAHGNFYQERAKEAGCDALIDKPIDMDSFEPILNQYLSPGL